MKNSYFILFLDSCDQGSLLSLDNGGLEMIYQNQEKHPFENVKGLSDALTVIINEVFGVNCINFRVDQIDKHYEKMVDGEKSHYYSIGLEVSHFGGEK